MDKVKPIAIIAFIISAYFLIYYFYQGILHPIPLAGDSFDYHIPIETSILNGSFLNPIHFTQFRWFYPGSTEALNSVFIILHIPLTLSNLFATIVLFFTCLKLGLTFLKNKYFSLLFASIVISLNVIVRWLNAVSIDIWLTIFFLISLIMLEKPQKKISYFLKLGLVTGMIIGSKYSAILFLIPLFLVYGKSIVSKLNLSRFMAFIIPFSTVGLFWYIRNLLVTKNPFYPVSILWFKGKELFIGNVFNVSVKYPIQMFNAFFGEYKLWILAPIFALLFIIYRVYKKQFFLNGISKIFIIGLINFIIYFSFPTSYQPWIMVSSLRYSYPVFIPLILGIFILSQNYKKEDLLGYFSIINALPVLSMVFYPKLVLILLPVTIIFLYLFGKFKFNK